MCFGFNALVRAVVVCDCLDVYSVAIVYMFMIT